MFSSQTIWQQRVNKLYALNYVILVCAIFSVAVDPLAPALALCGPVGWLLASVLLHVITHFLLRLSQDDDAGPVLH